MVRFADDHTVTASEIGEIHLGYLTLKNVLRMNIKANLISARMLAKDQGIISVFRENSGTLFIPNRGTLDFKVDSTTGLYVLESDSINSTGTTEFQPKPKEPYLLLTHQSRITDQELHELLGHASSQTLGKLFNRSFTLKSCEACAKAKIRHKRHFRRCTRETQLLRILHSDTVHAGVRSVDGALYFCTVMDEASKYLWILLLKTKKHLHDALIPLIKREQKKLGMDVCRLTTDGGTEYASNNLNSFLLEEGIEHSVKPRYDHAANGTIENCNQRVTLIAASILIASGLSLTFWSYAVEYACLLYNCLPTSALNWRSPHEALFNEKFDLKKLVLFGSKAMVHLPKDLREDGKFSDKALIGILLGYNVVNHAYYLYLPESRTYTESQTIQTGHGFCSKEELINWGIQREETIMPQLDNDELYEPSEDDNSDDTYVLDPQAKSTRASLSRKSKQQALRKIHTLQSENLLLSKAIIHPQIDNWRNNDIHVDCPKNFSEALQSVEWRQSMKKEIDALRGFKTWELQPPENLQGRKIHRSNWVFKRKDDGTAKSRLTFDGSKQTVGDVYSCVGSKTALRTFLKIMVQHNLVAKHIDISNAFVHGKLEPEEYVVMHQPPGFKEKGKEQWLCLVKKNLYGLKQAPKVWAQLLNESLRAYKLEQLSSDACLWAGNNMLLYVYVDDMIAAARDTKLLVDFLQYIQAKFVAKDLGFPKRVLGLEIEIQSGANGKKQILLHQQRYCEAILSRFGGDDDTIRSTPMEKILTADECEGRELNPSETKLYQRIVGSILYLAVCSRPDLAYSSSVLGRFSAVPRLGHFEAAQRVLQYIRGTRNLGILITGDSDDDLNAFADSDHCSETDRLSRNGYVIYWGTTPISWGSKKYTSAVPLSTTESEFYAATLAGTNALHLRNMTAELKAMQPLNHDLSKKLQPVTLWIDNLSCIKVLKRDGFECGTKHIDIRHLWIKKEIQQKRLKVEYVPTKDQAADILTKPLSKNTFNYQVKLLRLRPVLTLGGNV
jgi:hypothetical protein